MRRLRATLIVFSLLVSFLVGVEAAAGQSGGSSGQLVSSQMPLENVRIQGHRLSDVLRQFALKYDIPVGFEMACPGNVEKFYRIELAKGTLADLLQQFVADNNEYGWKIEDGVVSIFPKDGYGDAVVNQLLATEIIEFSLKKSTVIYSLSETLLSTPETAPILERYALTPESADISGFYFPQVGKEYSFSVSRMKLKSILDKIVKESPTAKFWTVSKNYSYNSITLLVSANFEYPPEERYLKDANFDDLIEPWP